MDFSVIIAYGLTVGIPALVIGFGFMINEIKSTIIIAYTMFVSFLAYYIYKEILPEWILIVVFSILGLLFVILYHNMLSGGE